MIYLPFAGGPRSCVGHQFALQELVIMTATFCRHLRFQLEPGHAVEPDPLITLRPKHGIRVNVFARDRSETLANIAAPA